MKGMKCWMVTSAIVMSLLMVTSCTDGEGEADGSNGVAAPGDEGEPLWTLHATLQGDPNALDGDIRLAFIWRSMVKPMVARDIAVALETPLAVDLSIFDLPDESILISTNEAIPQQLFTWEYSAMVDENFEPIEHPTVEWAQGKLVLYEDVNGNGELDLLSQDATETIDRIVGGAFTYEFYYIESDEEHPFPQAPDVTRGLNLVSLLVDRFDRRPISLENDIPITLDDSPEVQHQMCPYLQDKMWMDGTHDAPKACTVVPPSELLSHFPYGILPEIDGHCAGDGFIFEWFDTIVMDDALCSLDWYVHGDYHMARLAVGDDVPDYWPCEPNVENPTLGDYPDFVTSVATGNGMGFYDESTMDACVDLTADLIEHLEAQLD